MTGNRAELEKTEMGRLYLVVEDTRAEVVNLRLEMAAVHVWFKVLSVLSASATSIIIAMIVKRLG